MTPIHRILSDISAMSHEDVPPTPYAIATATRLIVDAGYTPLIGRASTSGGGELRIEWQSGDRSLRLVVPSDANSGAYLYYEDGANDYDTTVANGVSLGRWLDWVAST